jgi:hypothetical protein
MPGWPVACGAGAPTTAVGDVRYEVPLRGPYGRERSRTIRTPKSAETYQRELLAQRDRGGWVDPRAGRVTLAEWVSEWSTTLVSLRPSSRRIYLDNLRLHVLRARRRGAQQARPGDAAQLAGATLGRPPRRPGCRDGAGRRGAAQAGHLAETQSAMGADEDERPGAQHLLSLDPWRLLDPVERQRIWLRQQRPPGWPRCASTTSATPRGHSRSPPVPTGRCSRRCSATPRR